MKISDHFTKEEMIHTDTGLYNEPCPSEFENLIELCQEILEPVRTIINSKIKITSGYRSQEVNKKVKGKPNSQHLTGQAADFITLDCDLQKAYLAIVDSRIKYDQLILEPGWIHISWSKKPRCQHWII